MGYEVVEAETGAAAIELCATQMPHAIFVDWDLPDMSGFDFIVAFNRRFDSPRRPHIVYATTENDPIDISRALKTGADDFLLVPFNRADLEDKFPNVAALA